MNIICLIFKHKWEYNEKVGNYCDRCRLIARHTCKSHEYAKDRCRPKEGDKYLLDLEPTHYL
jgi:hypothetical protein